MPFAINFNDMFMLFIGTYVSLFSVVDPLMAAPVFVTLTDGQSDKDRNAVARRASMFSFAILSIFFITGSLILNFFQISIDALRIAGGLMILSSAYGMLNKQATLNADEEAEARIKATSHDDIAFSPLAMPILSGPGAIAVIIGMTTNAGGSMLNYLVIVLAILAVSFSSYLVMLISNTMMQKMGPTIVKAFTRIMGFILLCVGVQFLVNGISPVLGRALHMK
jgi:multiple antibiotic resistance protein